MPVTKIKLQNFTAFKDLEVEFSPGINALVGANGTGKTHLMKACYAACDTNKSHEEEFTWKVARVFLPSALAFDRLVHQAYREKSGRIEVDFGDHRLTGAFHGPGLSSSSATGVFARLAAGVVYIPAKDMLANAPGFLSLYAAREVHFEEVYRDILHRAYLPALREPIDGTHEKMLKSLENVVGGKVTVKGEEFFLSNEQGDLEFTLLAEGWRKLGLAVAVDSERDVTGWFRAFLG